MINIMFFCGLIFPHSKLSESSVITSSSANVGFSLHDLQLNDLATILIWKDYGK